MKRIGRFNLSDITLNRIFSALIVRLRDIPQSYSWFTNPLVQDNREFLSRYRGIHKGKRCFIVANGPSLKNTNLDLLKNEFTFGLNRIYLNFERSAFRPKYYVAMNELVLNQFSQEISRLTMPKFINWTQHSYYGPPNENTIYLKSKNSICDSFQYDLTQPIVVGATVTFATLQLAYFMGFHKVIIIGLDHNFAEKGTPNKIEYRRAEIDKSHFDSQYFPKGVKWQLPDLLRSEIDYEIARKAFELDGREILDATIGGKCNVFSKAEYLSFFK